MKKLTPLEYREHLKQIGLTDTEIATTLENYKPLLESRTERKRSRTLASTDNAVATMEKYKE